MGEGDYSADDIIILEGLDMVRYRPEMYIGRLGRRGLIGELAEAAMFLALNREWSGAQAVDVTIEEDGSVTCAYIGRSLPPTAVIRGRERAPMQEAFSVFQAVYSFLPPSEERERLYRLDLPVVNGLSAQLVARSAWEGTLYEQVFVRGWPQSPPLPVGTTGESGLSLRFWPDLALLRLPRIEARPIADWARRQARLAPGVAVRFRDARG